MSQIDDPKVAVGDGDESATDAIATGASPSPGTAKAANGAKATDDAPATDGAPSAKAATRATGAKAAPADGRSRPIPWRGIGADAGVGAATTELDELDDPDARDDPDALDGIGDAEDGSAELLDVALDDDLDDGYDEFWGEADGDAPDTGAAETAVRKKSRHQKRKEWRQTERARRYAARRSVRFPIFTRSVLLWMLLFAMMGAAFGGSSVFFWAHFNTQISELREQTSDFDKRSQEARGEIDTMRNQAVTEINNQLKPIAPFLAEANTIKQAQTLSPYVWFVATLDENGNPAVGSAFSVKSDDSTTLMITSYNTIKAATVTPGPAIGVRKGQEEITATLVGFDPDRDLALLEVPRANMPILEWASDQEQAEALGLRVFPVSGFGATGASLTSGIIIDQSAAGILHTAPVGTDMQGGPIVSADYKVIGVASTIYHPLGFDPGETHFSVQINSTCAVLLECGGGARTKKPS